MTEKQKKTVPPATENEQPAVEYKPPEVTAEAPAPAPSPFPREEIEKAFSNPMLKGFKKYLDPLLTYFESVEARLQEADKNFNIIGTYLKDRDAKLEPLVRLGEQIQARQQQAQTTAAGAPAPGGFDIGSLAQLIPMLLQGGGSNPIGDEITKKIIDAGLDSMFSGQRFLKAVQDKMLANMGAKVVEEAMPK